MEVSPYLCQRCANQEIWFKEAWHLPLGTYAFITLGTLDELRSAPNCPFCRLVLSAMTEGPRVFDHPNASWIPSSRGFNVGPAGTRIVFHEIDSPSWVPKAGRSIDSSCVDPALIQQWFDLCERHHGDQCRPIPLQPEACSDVPQIPNFRVIDVVQNCIVDAPSGCDYLALSYVWGQAEQVRLLKDKKRVMMTTGGLDAEYCNLPNTIKDAMVLVGLIGKRYLWVDALCLVQDDEKDMAAGVVSMDLIYGGATATIIAASGIDANSGLPGVRPDSRHAKQTIEEIGPGTRMMVLRDIDHHLQVSKYSTRGWTFQEQMLSRRSLIFINNCVYFRCRRCAWCEDNTDHLYPEVDNQAEELLGSLIPLALDPTEPALSAYQILLLYFSRRELTKDNDAINAFVGMLRFLSTRMKTPILEGLPTASFDISLLFFGSELRRRPGFPSYSWAGWSGPVQGPKELDWHWPEDDSIVKLNPNNTTINANEWLDTKTWVLWYEKSPLGELRMLAIPSSGDQPNRTLDDKGPYNVSYNDRRHPFLSENLPRRPTIHIDYVHTYPILQFWTYTVQLSLVSSKDEEGSKMLQVTDRRGQVCGHVAPNNVELIDISVPAEFLLLSECRYSLVDDFRVTENHWIPQNTEVYALDSIWNFYRVMLVWWENGIAERRGIGTIHKRSLDWAYEPGKLWKEIVLK